MALILRTICFHPLPPNIQTAKLSEERKSTVHLSKWRREVMNPSSLAQFTNWGKELKDAS